MNKPLPTMLPVQHYFKCIDADGKPDDYAGDWPRKGGVYTGSVKPSFYTGVPHVFLDGFHSEEPYGSFAFGRFVYLGAIWLN